MSDVKGDCHNTDGIDTVSPYGLRAAHRRAGGFPQGRGPNVQDGDPASVGRLLSAAVQEIVTFAPDVVVYHPKILSAPVAANRV
ncbi:UNVERIFIED_ORG: hypothetical protein J2X79_002506 [Arthrobacter globiformis]|nr:hypothetical protein [Arthrobacter globiformis]